MGNDDRRREKRTPFAANVEVAKGGAGGWCKAIARDVSAAGMFLQTDFECSLMDEMTIRFLLIDTSFYMEVRGRVARRDLTEDDSVDGMVGVGLEFKDTPGWVLEELRRYVEDSLASDSCEIVLSRGKDVDADADAEVNKDEEEAAT